MNLWQPWAYIESYGSTMNLLEQELCLYHHTGIFLIRNANLLDERNIKTAKKLIHFLAILHSYRTNGRNQSPGAVLSKRYS